MKLRKTSCASWLVAILLVAPSGASEQKTGASRQEIRAKIGQLFMLAFSGTDPNEVAPLIRDRGIGGAYLSNENLSDPATAANLLNHLQDAAMEGISHQPLLTAADQEGAWAVMVPHSSSGPGNMALGAADPAYTQKMYSVFGRELSAVGVFCDLAPVSDVNSNPDNPIIDTRSFGEFPARVAEHVQAAIKGLHSENVIATSKHFPGHGNTSSDSHSGLPRVNRPKNEIEAIDLAPFKAAVAANVDVIMTAHIFYDALDPDHPATLSRKILQDYLRGELGFKGVVITDSFNMDAIRKHYSPPDAAVAALLAGADMILLAEERYGDNVGNYRKAQLAILDRVEQAVASGELPIERLNEAYTRITDLKRRYRLAQRLHADPVHATSVVGSPEDRAVSLSAARAAALVVYDKKHLLPLRRDAEVWVTRLATDDVAAIMAGMRGIGPNYSNGYNDFTKALGDWLVKVHEFSIGDAVPANAVVLAVGENYPLPGKSLNIAAQHRRMEELQSQYAGRLVYVGLRDPYDAYQIAPDAYITALGSNYSNAVAAAELLKGQISSSGTLPVSPRGKHESATLKVSQAESGDRLGDVR